MPKQECSIQFNNPTEILVSGPQELETWRSEQSVDVPGAKYSPAFQRHGWDGTYSPGRWCRPRAPAAYAIRGSRGLLGRLAASFTLVTDVSNGVVMPSYTQEAIGVWLMAHPVYDTLYDYQKQAVLCALQEQWGRVALATNAGKGAVIGLLAQFAMEHSLHVRVLCDEIAVFDALMEELAKWTGLIPGQVNSGQRTIPTERVVVAMVPTLSRRLGRDPKKLTAANIEWREWLATTDMLLLDEADKATAKSWGKVLSCAKQSVWRVGFSGTFPNAADDPHADLKLDELMGHVFIREKNLGLVQRGISATPQVELQRYDTTSLLSRTPAGFWDLSAPQRRQTVYEITIMNNTFRHSFIASLIRPGIPTAVIVNRVAHGEALELFIPGAVYVDGSCTTKQRRAALDAFQRGEIRVLIVTKILDRGTNRLGTAADLIFVSGEGSARQTLQRIGRGLRRTGGKEFLRLVDVIDRVELNGAHVPYLKAAARYLHKAARKRIALYQSEGFDVEIG